jgi:hypothetical protein
VSFDERGPYAAAQHHGFLTNSLTEYLKLYQKKYYYSLNHNKSVAFDF